MSTPTVLCKVCKKRRHSVSFKRCYKCDGDADLKKLTKSVESFFRGLRKKK